MNHPKDEIILRYLSDESGEDEQMEMDAHMANCSRCRDRVRAMAYLRENFDSLWNTWTASEHGRVHHQLQLAAALEEVVQSSSSLAPHAMRWRKQLGTALEVAIKVIVDQTKRVATMAQDMLLPGQGFELRTAAPGVGSAEELTRVSDHLNKGSRLLSQDRPDEAVSELLKAAGIDARSPQAAVSDIYHEGTWVFQVVADSRRARISVKYMPREGEITPVFALLLSQDPGTAARYSAFEAVEGEDYLLAEFEELPDGPYRIEIASLSDAE
ncbi:MAG: hypothetical protein KJ645_01135 [Planctomycetes bacterium]|nr:hypothetical protein [Planctomycetota bacterium]